MFAYLSEPHVSHLIEPGFFAIVLSSHVIQALDSFVVPFVCVLAILPGMHEMQSSVRSMVLLYFPAPQGMQFPTCSGLSAYRPGAQGYLDPFVQYDPFVQGRHLHRPGRPLVLPNRPAMQVWQALALLVGRISICTSPYLPIGHSSLQFT
jgi:hypothetical protein